MPRPLLTVSQSDYLIQIVDINSYTEWQTVQIQIGWLLQKPTDLDLHCLPLSCWINYDAMPTSNCQPIRLLDPDCWHKFIYWMANSADSDRMASSEANWSGCTLFAIHTLFAKAGYIWVQQDKGYGHSFNGYVIICTILLSLSTSSWRFLLACINCWTSDWECNRARLMFWYSSAVGRSGDVVWNKTVDL